jgi:hypothetical protein
MHAGVEELYSMRQAHLDGGAEAMSEIEASLSAFFTQHELSMAATKDLCQLRANRDVIGPAHCSTAARTFFS